MNVGGPPTVTPLPGTRSTWRTAAASFVYQKLFFDALEIAQTSRDLGHVPIIDKNPRRKPGAKAELEAETRRQRYAGYRLAEDLRYNERSGAERVNGRLKDDFGGRYVRVRGHAKVLCHLMFGILALTCDQLLRLIV